MRANDTVKDGNLVLLYRRHISPLVLIDRLTGLAFEVHPGFGLPFNYEPEDEYPDRRPFPSALDPRLGDKDCPDSYRSYGRARRDDHPARLPAFTLRELAMVAVMNSITDKPGWELKEGVS
ncbi:hypothetical protein NP233_g12045 [Leucocoprinus birnbaumii]|uniref:DUF4246 domain-containing protein n=1 Tax=Leucocoprinus birnbaumii TaxID=56174 RepID=A0AAD5VFT9_9AGAR|nr:hypothetical protein NP233_g12045 [Leucocoprinus birnbaumii]